MDTTKLALDNTWKAIGDGTKQVLIEARTGKIAWCNSAAVPAAGADTAYHVLNQGEQILLPVGVKLYVRQAGTDDTSVGTFIGEVIHTIYP